MVKKTRDSCYLRYLFVYAGIVCLRLEKRNRSAMKVEAKPEAMGPVESLDSKPLGISEGRTTEGMLPVYFDFDSSDIRKDQVSRVEVNADFIKNNPK